MTRPFTVLCAYTSFFIQLVHVEAENLEDGLEKALKAADEGDSWRPTDHCGPLYVHSACEGTVDDPSHPSVSLPVPDRYTEAGEPPLLTFHNAGTAEERIEIAGGRAFLRFRTAYGDVAAELRDPPPPPSNHPLVTVRRRADGAPDVEVRDGEARVHILDG